MKKIVTKGRVSIEQVALEIATQAWLETGGIASSDWRVVSFQTRRPVSDPTLARYGLVECKTRGFDAAVRSNVVASDGTLRLGRDTSQLCRNASRLALEMGRPFMQVDDPKRPSWVWE